MPADLQNKWRFLFSSKIMGESFSTMLGKLLKRGPTLLVVEDEDHYIFAAYASHSWALGPNFIGETCLESVFFFLYDVKCILIICSFFAR